MVGSVEEVTVFSLKAEENFEATFKKSERAVRSLTRKMEDYEQSIGKSSTELIILKAKQKGATDEQLRHLKAVQSSITAKQAEVDALRQASAAAAKNEKSIEQLVIDLKRESMAIGKTTQQLQLERAARAGATTAQLQQIKALQNNIVAQRNATRTGKGLHGQLRLMRGGFGQIGHQIQDVAVQLQMGTNAMLVFGQQGSQVASLFGPHGAMIGAVLAVTAAFFTYLQASKKTAEETDKLTDSIKEYAKEAGKLAGADQAFLIVQEEKAIRKLTEARKEETASYTDDLVARNKSFAVQLRQMEAQNLEVMRLGSVEQKAAALARTQEFVTQHTQANRDATVTFAASLADTDRQLTTHNANLERYRQGNVDAGVATARVVEALREQLLELRLSERELAIHNAIMDGATNAQLLQIHALHKRLDAEREAARERKKEASQVEAEQKAAERQLESNKKFVESLQLKAENLGKTKRQVALLRAEQQGMTVDQIAAINLAYDEIEAYDAKTQASKELTKQFEAEKAARDALQSDAAAEAEQAVTDFDALKDSYKTELDLLYEQQQAKLKIVQDAAEVMGLTEQQTAGVRLKIAEETAAAEKAILVNSALSAAQTAQDQLMILSGIFGEQSAMGKAAFVVSQGIAMANALINTEVAATKALAALPPPFNVAMSKVIRSLGYASVGVIAGQTIASFEGGGFTGSGPRAGGVDGRGGFNAILHPNETVIDHSLTSRREQTIGLSKSDIDRMADGNQPKTSTTTPESGTTTRATVVNINVTAADTKDFDRLLTDRRAMLASLINKELNRQGRAL